jgi:hypothetical protein
LRPPLQHKLEATENVTTTRKSTWNRPITDLSSSLANTSHSLQKM